MKTRSYYRLMAVAALLCAAPATVFAQGIAISGVGPVNRAMAGASTAAPVEAAGALHWNPATIAALPSSEVSFGLELLLPHEQLSSSVMGVGGTTGGDPGGTPIPTIGWVHKNPCSPWTIGLGMYGIAGFKVNYPGSLTNPVLAPQPVGAGSLSAEAQLFQIAPTVAYQMTDNLSIGFAPTITMAQVIVDPFLFAAPAGGPGMGYPTGVGSRYHWGAGFQIGAYYTTDSCWNFGATFKSPQWFEKFKFNADDPPFGTPRSLASDIDYPMIISVGASYTGIQNWLFAMDVRYWAYSATDGLGDPAQFLPSGAVDGLGWNDIFSVHTAAQYRFSDSLVLRFGYVYQENPIDDVSTIFNIATPLIIEHLVSVGASYNLTCNVALNATYVRGLENTQSGPIQVPGLGALPGTSVSNEISADAFVAGVTVQY